MEKKTTRHFGGKTEGFKDKTEQRKEQKHLKAYLRGAKSFNHGKHTDGSPVTFQVIEQWY